MRSLVRASLHAVIQQRPLFSCSYRVFARQVESWSQLRQLLTLGISARAEADTPENSKSSRGHAILTLEVRRAGAQAEAEIFGCSFKKNNLSLVVCSSNRTSAKRPTAGKLHYFSLEVFEQYPHIPSMSAITRNRSPRQLWT